MQLATTAGSLFTKYRLLSGYKCQDMSKTLMARSTPHRISLRYAVRVLHFAAQKPAKLLLKIPINKTTEALKSSHLGIPRPEDIKEVFLKHRKLWQQMSFKEFHSLVGDDKRWDFSSYDTRSSREKDSDFIHLSEIISSYSDSSSFYMRREVQRFSTHKCQDL
ncbi:hypothetical protein NPIL_92331 [Nephila pilipes]|uniref:Uncharacterized protein n=1 Tax=Nephila pilipes TaxID=299642 RepID=A0A8X6PBQ0_NEPPI|nr:hypothetical protein NPIL_92331 [Nephila pilipes]